MPHPGDLLARRHVLPILGALALAALTGWTVISSAETVRCREAQTALLRNQEYAMVPERAAYAAKRYCELHAGKVVSPRELALVR